MEDSEKLSTNTSDDAGDNDKEVIENPDSQIKSGSNQSKEELSNNDILPEKPKSTDIIEEVRDPKKEPAETEWYQDTVMIALGGVALILFIAISILLVMRALDARKIKKRESQKQSKNEDKTDYDQLGKQREIDRLRRVVSEHSGTIQGQSGRLREKDKEIEKLKIEIETLKNKCNEIETQKQLQEDNYKNKLDESQKQLDQTKESLWPAALLQSSELKPLLENIQNDYFDKKSEAQELHAALQKIALKEDPKAIVKETVPLSQAFYKWLENISISNDFAELLSSWLTKKVSSTKIIIKPVKIGESYSDSHHSCSSPNGLSIIKVHSFLILSEDNNVIKKAQVEVGV